jgi:sulfur carrier protein ThiS
VKVLLRNPTREVDVDGPIAVTSLVERFGFRREAVLVISDGELVPGDARLDDSAVVEIRPVISGG